MKTSSIRTAIVHVTVCLGLTASLHAAALDLPLEAVGHVWAVPYQVHVEDVNGGAIVSGRLRTTTANPGRRLHGRVWAEFVDRDGNVVAAYDAIPHRISPARHTRRARFEIPIDRVPERAAGIRVVYR